MKKHLNLVYIIFAFVLLSSCDPSESETVTPPTNPVLTTTAADDITTNSAVSGGTIVNTGASAVTARGVVWDVNPNPAIVLETKTVNGEGTGNFTASLNGLSSGTEYHLRAYATNNEGTFYGNDIVFTTMQPTLTLGMHYRGGTIAYFLKPGDPGYSATIKHGLIVDPTDNEYAEWSCYSLIGTTSSAFGTGLQNTLNIAAACNETDTLIAVVNASAYGGYNDWYVPSKEELLRIRANWDSGLLPYDLFTNGNYWTSTEYNNQKAYIIEMEYGNAEPFYKYSQETVCAVRAF